MRHLCSKIIIAITLLCSPQVTLGSNLGDFFQGKSGPTWVGYTGTFNGARGGTKGFNAQCNTSFSGSHACTWDEIIKLNTSYPYTYDAWIVDGAYHSGALNIFTKDGNDGIASGEGAANCTGWGSSSSGNSGGAVLDDTSGSLWFDTCNLLYRIPCCK